MAKARYAHDQIVRAINEGKTYTEIASMLGCTRGTVSDYCRRIGIAYNLNDRLRQRRLQIQDRLESGMSAIDIAQEIGCSLPLVYKVGRECGHEFNGLSVMPEHGDEVIALVRAGETFTDVGKRFGCSKNAVADYCHKRGVRSRWEDHNQWGEYDERLRRAVKVIEKHAPMFEYVGGFTDTDSPVDLRCKVCGIVKRVSMACVRHDKVECVECRRAETEKRQLQRREEKAVERKERRDAKTRERLLERIKSAEQTVLRFCSCGAPLAGKRFKHCADCARRIENKHGELRRRVKLKSAWVDSDITVQGVFRRDGGRCWLCGEQCNPNDFVERDGVIICGDQYPSIDHVIPLSKGGEHSWANVKLAHRRCNYLKSDSMPPGCA